MRRRGGGLRREARIVAPPTGLPDHHPETRNEPPGIPATRLADRLGPGEGGVQAGDRPPPQGHRHALERARRRRHEPPPRPLRRRTPPVGRLLVPTRQGRLITTYVTPTRRPTSNIPSWPVSVARCPVFRLSTGSDATGSQS